MPDRETILIRAASPVGHAADETPEPEQALDPGIALCLSGGGFRAMLFHLGALWRLNELGYLPRLSRISSVSGGSITAGLLGLRWSALAFDDQSVSQQFQSEIVAPLRRLAGKSIDVPAIVLGVLGPGSVGNRIAGSYRRHLFGRTTLQDLPDVPRFVFNATNLQSGALWRFSKPYMRDWRVGEVRNPAVDLATAVAASSAFPPFLSPVVLRFRREDYSPPQTEDLHRPPFTTKVVLSDGGVYDNLGLETAWKRHQTVLISDGGGRMKPAGRPPRNWPFQAYRVLSVIDTQVRNLRKRQAIDAYKTGLRKGTYWGIWTDIADYRVPCLPCPHEQTLALAGVCTRLGRLDATVQERVINWGYAVCDAALRAHVDGALPPAGAFPYPDTGVG